MRLCPPEREGHAKGKMREATSERTQEASLVGDSWWCVPGSHDTRKHFLSLSAARPRALPSERVATGMDRVMDELVPSARVPAHASQTQYEPGPGVVELLWLLFAFHLLQ